MSFAAKSSKSIRKKSTTTQQSPYIGTKALMFAHEITSSSQTVINLSALNTPSATLGRGFVQPSASDLATAQLLFYRKNLTLMSSLRGDLWDYDSYDVTGNASIRLNFTPEVGEIFVGKISDVAKSGLQAIDGKALSVTGTLLPGQTDFVVGQSFSVNKFPSAQVGDIKAFIDGILQARNTGNAAASASADGNYQELDSGSGLANTIRFNVADSTNSRSITVVSNGMLAERPEGSLRAEIESLAGQIDQIIPTLAQLAGVAETAFQSAPNDVDLKTFGDRVLDLETRTPKKDVANTFAGSNTFNGQSTFAGQASFSTPPTRTDAAAVSGNTLAAVISGRFGTNVNNFQVVTTIPYATDDIYTLSAIATSNNGPGGVIGTFGYNGAGPSFVITNSLSGIMTVSFANVGGFVAITFAMTGAANIFGQWQITGMKV